MPLVRACLDWLRRYMAHPDPLANCANTIALIVASNQPFYPLYLWWLVSDQIEPAYYTFLSTPFFLLVPALMRMNSVAGRALLPLAGIANTVLCAKLFGVGSAVEIFLIPCAVLALLLYRPAERLTGYAICALAFVVFFLLHGRYGAPAVAYSPAELEALARLNAVSASALTALAALMFSNLLANSAKTTGEKESG